MTDNPLFTQAVPGVRLVHGNDDGKVRVIFGTEDTGPKFISTLDKHDAIKTGVALAAVALGRPMYSRAVIAAAFAGVSTVRSPSRLRVLVSDSGRVYRGDVYGVTGTAVTLNISVEKEDGKEILRDVQPIDILHMEIQR
jgi:hypothetical protein